VGLVDISECGRCTQTSGTASRCLSDCETPAALRVGYLGHHFMKPGALRRLRPQDTALGQQCGGAECLGKVLLARLDTVEE